MYDRGVFESSKLECYDCDHEFEQDLAGDTEYFAMEHVNQTGHTVGVEDIHMFRPEKTGTESS